MLSLAFCLHKQDGSIDDISWICEVRQASALNCVLKLFISTSELYQPTEVKIIEDELISCAVFN